MNRIIWFGLVLLVQFGYTDSDCGCNKTTPPLKLIFDVVPHFKETQFCKRICKSDYHVSTDGVRHIGFKCKLKECETPSELCGCVYNYISQMNWLNGSTAKCCVEDNFVTLQLKGQPDPTIINEKDPSTDPPLKQLQEILDQFPQAELANHNCRPKTSVDDCGCIHCKIECDLQPDSPCKENICKNIVEYLNQGNWLNRSTSLCTSTAKLLNLDIIGDLQPGSKCVSKYSKAYSSQNQ